jgi:hypothetical protein
MKPNFFACDLRSVNESTKHHHHLKSVLHVNFLGGGNVKNLISGAIAGTAATFPMSAAMLALHECGPLSESNPLPPELITRSVVNRTSRGRKLKDERKVELAIAAHFGYGAATGALFGLVTPPRMNPGAAAALGAAYGVGVWAASYFGWVPALDVLPSANRFSKYRNAMMITSHVVWGASLGATYASLTDSQV